MGKYYIDTCIWRDYSENRSDRFRPLGEWAFRLIKKIIDECDLVFYSNLVEKELRWTYSEKEIKEIIKIVPPKLLIKLKNSNEQFKEAVGFSEKLGIPVKDALHAILARDNNAVLISRDKHFYELQKQVTVRKPEELI